MPRESMARGYRVVENMRLREDEMYRIRGLGIIVVGSIDFFEHKRAGESDDWIIEWFESQEDNQLTLEDVGLG